MTSTGSRTVPFLLLGVVLLVLSSVVAYSVFASVELPDGPVDIVWDKAPCAACGMHVGEPPFAAQLTTSKGETIAFDDPGCLFLYLEDQQPEVHQMYFHHWQEDRWIAGDAAAFAAVEVTPMGFGIGAVDKGTADAISYEAARDQCLERRRRQRQR